MKSSLNSRLIIRPDFGGTVPFFRALSRLFRHKSRWKSKIHFKCRPLFLEITILFTSLFGKNENQFGKNEIQFGKNEIEFGINEIQFGRNKI